MRNLSILVGAAALAMTAPTIAKPGGGNGGGNKGGGGPAKVERGGGGGQKASRGGGGSGGQKVDRRAGGGQKADRGGGGQRAERGRGGGQRMAAPKGRGNERREARADNPQRKMERGPAKVREARRQEERGNDRKVRVAEDRGRGNVERRVDRKGGSRTDQRQVDRRIVERTDRDIRGGLLLDRRGDYLASSAFRSTGLIDGCPPGLAAKNNGCLPPGQAKKLVGGIAPALLGSALLPPLYRSWYPDNDEYFYRTRDDYVYRIDRDRNYVDAYWPLADDWTGAYYVGAAYPDEYLGYYNVPVQYRPWYADNDEDYYRYGDGAIYQVDRDGGVIEAIVSLLAGGFGVGQPLPTGYDVYNVPFAYRDRYVDTQDSWYRYNDGYIYEVDPTTRIVQAIVETLV